jgi:hypothetical protein
MMFVGAPGDVTAPATDEGVDGVGADHWYPLYADTRTCTLVLKPNEETSMLKQKGPDDDDDEMLK